MTVIVVQDHNYGHHPTLFFNTLKWLRILYPPPPRKRIIFNSFYFRSYGADRYSGTGSQLRSPRYFEIMGDKWTVNGQFRYNIA